MVIGSSDGRRQFPEASRRMQVPMAPIPVGDPYNNDLYASVMSIGAASGPAAVTAAAAPAPAAPDPMDRVERAGIDAMHSLRVKGLRICAASSTGTARSRWMAAMTALSLTSGATSLTPACWTGLAAAITTTAAGVNTPGGSRKKQTEIFYAPGRFVPMFSYERSVQYPEGHRNVIFVQRGIRTLPRLPKVDESTPGPAPDTQMLYAYLKAFDGIVASHTSGTNMGTDWRDNDPLREPVVEIYQGERQNYEMPGAPRTNTADDSIGGWRPKGFVNLALEKGYKMSFQASSDHISTHMSYSNIFAADYTREALLDGVKKRHVYAATDNILADFRSGEYMMGDEFSTATAPELHVKLVGTAPFAKVQVIKDNAYVLASGDM
jgi:hypothetical protein